IIAGWADQKVIREFMLFLHSNGVGISRAVRIYMTYGTDVVQLISENPYRLARDIRGIGFRTADRIAAKLGIEKTALIRVRAGIAYALSRRDIGIPGRDGPQGRVGPGESSTSGWTPTLDSSSPPS